MARTVTGFFTRQEDATASVRRLTEAGVNPAAIRVRENALTEGVSRRDEDNGLGSFFRSLFGGEGQEGGRHTGSGQRSGVSITVHTQSEEEANRVASLLQGCGALNISRQGSASSEAAPQAGAGAPEMLRSSPSPLGASEALDLGTRTVEHGGVRVRSRIVERPVEEQLRLREEGVSIERTPVDRPASEEELQQHLHDQDIEFIERAEVPVVRKEARVVEEIRISRDQGERETTVRETVRRTEVDIERPQEGHRGSDTRPLL
jgi:hypothetical protein